jgi:hypothetical protein
MPRFSSAFDCLNDVSFVTYAEAEVSATFVNVMVTATQVSFVITRVHKNKTNRLERDGPFPVDECCER